MVSGRGWDRTSDIQVNSLAQTATVLLNHPIIPYNKFSDFKRTTFNPLETIVADLTTTFYSRVSTRPAT